MASVTSSGVQSATGRCLSESESQHNASVSKTVVVDVGPKAGGNELVYSLV